MARSGATKSLAIKVKSTDDGLHLSGSILWFDAHVSGDLSFLSSAIEHTKKTQGPQILATEETIKILEVYHKKPKALVCQYNRPFSIGRLKIELLPSGAVLGGASLYVETDQGRLLYAPMLQAHRITTARQMQLKKANTLILGAYHPDPNAVMPSRRKEKERLVSAIKDFLARDEYPIVLCRAVATAQELTKLLSDSGIPLAAHNTIYKVNRVYESYGSPLGQYGLYNPRNFTKRVLLFPGDELAASSHLRLKRTLPEGPILAVEDTLTGNWDTSLPVDGRFHISSSCDGKELREVIATVDPKEIFVFGPYAKRYVEEFSSLALRVRPLYANDQPTLF